jgi:hypothetical protein
LYSYLGGAAGIWGVGAMSGVSQSECADLSQPDSRGQLIDGLRQQLGRWGAATEAEEGGVFSCGAAAVDRLLPGGGLRHGMLVEWVGACGGSGAATLGLLGAREACRAGGVLVVIDRSLTFYPPAAAAWGIDLERLIVVRPNSARDELWAAVQALRSPVVAALWTTIERLDSRAFRRLQLAAEAGHTLGVLMRPAGAREQPSWADVRLEVEGKLQNAKCKMKNANWEASAIENLQFAICNLQSLRFGQPTKTGSSDLRHIQVRVLRCHPGRAGGLATLEIDDVTRMVREVSSTHDTHSLPVVAKLADSASRSLSARA